MVKVETSNPKSLKAMSIIAILMGIGLGIFSLYLYYDYNSKKETYIPTKGVVVDYEEKKDIGEDRYTYAAIVEFEVDGKKYRVTQNSSSSNPPEIDSEMEIRYNKSNLQDVIFDKDPSRIWIPIIAGVFFGGGILFLSASKKNRI